MLLLVVVLAAKRYGMLDTLEALAGGPRGEHHHAPAQPEESCSDNARTVKVLHNFYFVLRWNPQTLSSRRWKYDTHKRRRQLGDGGDLHHKLRQPP